MAGKDKDMGGITIVGGADPEKRLVILAFSSQVNRIELTPEGARDVAKMLVGRSLIADGTMPPDAKMTEPKVHPV